MSEKESDEEVRKKDKFFIYRREVTYIELLCLIHCEFMTWGVLEAVFKLNKALELRVSSERPSDNN